MSPRTSIKAPLRSRVSTGASQASPRAPASPASPGSICKVKRSPTGELIAVAVRKGPASPASPASTAAPSSPALTAGSLEDSLLSPRYLRKLGRLGAHYEKRPLDGQDLVASPRDVARDDHDAMLADTLHKQRPSDAPPLLLATPRGGGAAFTDRAARLREGRGLRATLMKDDHEPTEWAHHGDCTCTVCKPFDRHQAGAASHECHRLVPFAADGPPTPRLEANTFNSSQLSRSMSHPAQSGPLHVVEELSFAKGLGRKNRDIPPRSWSKDDLRAAGTFNQEYRPEIMASTSKGRQPFQGSCKDLLTPRSGAALALSPRAGDPPPPLQLLAERRGDGAFKGGFSTEAAFLHTRLNQQVFRYDPEITTPRGRISGPSCYEDQGAGLTSRGFSERQNRQHPSSPKLSPRALVGSRSDLMQGTLNHAQSARALVKEAENRSRVDVPFVSLCHQTAQHLRAQRVLCHEVKQLCGTQTVNVAEHLTWAA